ncbi:hypothetical protein Q9966_009307 [Columba livia]|nr:hypothetical protein Q9966_009307 [Columba livia]
MAKLTERHGVCSDTLLGKPHFCSMGQGSVDYRSPGRLQPSASAGREKEETDLQHLLLAKGGKIRHCLALFFQVLPPEETSETTNRRLRSELEV